MSMKLKATLMLVSALGAAQAYALEPVKLGFIAAQSGPLGVLGAEQKRGLDLALEALGGKLGDRPVELYTSDSRGVPGTAVQEVSKLIEKEGVDVITGGTASNEILAMVKPISKAGVTLVGSNGGPSPLAGKECNPGYYSVAFQNDQWSNGMGTYMSDHGVKRAYFIGMDYQAGWDHVGGAQSSFKGETVAKVFTPQAQLDFSAELAQIRAAKPDGVFAFYPGGAAIAFVKQYAQAGLSKTIPLYSNAGLVDTLFLPSFGDNAVGVVISSHYSADLDNPANKKFVADFQAKYKRDPSSYAASQYDAVMLIDHALRAVGGDKIDKAKLRAALATAKFDSVRGAFKFNTNHMPIQNIYVQKVERDKNGELTLRLLGVAQENAADRYAQDCAMPK
ncbi:ABC transporter substrate-binding protein [Eoetvoesiella caeni]